MVTERFFNSMWVNNTLPLRSQRLFTVFDRLPINILNCGSLKIFLRNTLMASSLILTLTVYHQAFRGDE